MTLKRLSLFVALATPLAASFTHCAEEDPTKTEETVGAIATNNPFGPLALDAASRTPEEVNTPRDIDFGSLTLAEAVKCALDGKKSGVPSVLLGEESSSPASELEDDPEGTAAAPAPRTAAEEAFAKKYGNAARRRPKVRGKRHKKDRRRDLVSTHHDSGDYSADLLKKRKSN